MECSVHYALVSTFYIYMYDVNDVPLFQAILATIMIIVGNIGELIDAFSAAAFVFYLLVFIALIILRVTHPKEPRPFKVLLPYTCAWCVVFVLTCTCAIDSMIPYWLHAEVLV